MPQTGKELEAFAFSSESRKQNPQKNLTMKLFHIALDNTFAIFFDSLYKINNFGWLYQFE